MLTFTSKADEEFFGAFGRVAITWSQIEFGIDVLVMTLHWRMGGQHTIERVAPWSISRKLDYVKRYYRKHHPTYHGTHIICQLMDDISSASDIRHDLLHGFIIEHAQGTSEATLMRFLRDSSGDLPKEKRFDITTSAILQHAANAIKLANKVINLTARVVSTLDKQNKPVGES